MDVALDGHQWTLKGYPDRCISTDRVPPQGIIFAQFIGIQCTSTWQSADVFCKDREIHLLKWSFDHHDHPLAILSVWPDGINSFSKKLCTYLPNFMVTVLSFFVFLLFKWVYTTSVYFFRWNWTTKFVSRNDTKNLKMQYCDTPCDGCCEISHIFFIQ